MTRNGRILATLGLLSTGGCWCSSTNEHEINLVVTDASSKSQCSNGQCSVSFTLMVKNTGPTTAWGAEGGAYWSSAAPVVSGCSSTGGSSWNARNSLGTNIGIAPGATHALVVNGPGYVGGTLPTGTVLNVTLAADPCNGRSETDEKDNTRSMTFTI